MKHFAKTIALLAICCLTFFTACHEDEHVHDEHNESNVINDFGIKERKINLNDLNNMPKAKVKLAKITEANNNAFANRGFHNSLYDFYINTDSITMIENGDYHSLTFPIYRIDNEENIVENLVLMLQDDKTYLAAIYKYELSPEEQRILMEGGQTLITGDVSRTILPDFDTGFVTDALTPVFYTDIIYVPCSSTEHNSGNLGQWHTCTADIKPKILVITRMIVIETPDEVAPVSGSEISSGGYGGSIKYNPNVPPFDPNKDFEIVKGNITKPLVLPTAEQNFFNSLSSKEKVTLQNNQNVRIKILEFLELNISPTSPNVYNTDAVNLMKEILQIAENQGTQYAIDIIEAYTNIENTLVYVGPDTPIASMAQYLSVFDVNQPATITLYVDQPVPNTNIITDGQSVGHTYIGIKQGTKSRTFGFYPSGSSNPADPADPSKMGDDSSRHFDVSISKQVIASDLQIILDYSINYPATYDLNTFNCTDFGIEIGNLCGFNLPQCNSWWYVGFGSNPAKLGQYIRANFSTSNQHTVNKTGGYPNPNN